MRNAETEGRKLTLQLGAEAVSDLRWIANQYGGIAISDVLRRAVATEKYLLEQQRSGNIIVFENLKTGAQQEFVLG